MKHHYVIARRCAMLLILPALILAGCTGAVPLSAPAPASSVAPAAGTAASPSVTATQPISGTTAGGISPQSTSGPQQSTDATTVAAAPTVAPALATSAPVSATAPAVATAPPVAAATRTVSPTQTISATRSTPGTPPAASVLYQDDFKDPTSGWPDELVFQDYYVGYHEPDFYHVEVHVPNDSAIVSAPGHTFENFEAETRVLISQANTAPAGDFRYGLAIRRAGNRYYAFTVSARSQRWYVLKSGAGNLRVLDQGAQVPILGLKSADTLRVNADGPLLTFWVDGVLVSQINDPDYAGGEVGFYVETFDSPKAHVHFDNLIVRLPENPPPQGPSVTPAPTQQPNLACTVTVDLLRMRAAPRGGNEPTIAGLFAGTQLDASARNADGSWLWVRIHGQDQVGWVSAQPGLVSCNGQIAALAVATPASANTTRTP